MNHPLPSARPASLRDRNKQRLRRQIVDSALQLVSSRGLGNVTADDIAAHAEVGRATFFRYFESKEAAIIVALYEQWLTQLVAMLNAAPAALGPMDAVIWTFRELGAVSDDREHKLLRLHTRMVTDSPTLRAKAMEFHARYVQAIADAVAPRFKRRRADDLRPRLLATAALAVVQASVEHWVERNGVNPNVAALQALQHLKLGFSERMS